MDEEEFLWHHRWATGSHILVSLHTGSSSKLENEMLINDGTAATWLFTKLHHNSVLTCCTANGGAGQENDALDCSIHLYLKLEKSSKRICWIFLESWAELINASFPLCVKSLSLWDPCQTSFLYSQCSSSWEIIETQSSILPLRDLSLVIICISSF